MTARVENLMNQLAAHSPFQLDASTRGSGLNATWKLSIEGRPVVLKTYSSRRGPVKTLFTHIEHTLTGRTSYSPAARQRTERRNLALWSQAGFAVPALIDRPFSPPLPLPHLCMEYVPGPTLSDAMTDLSTPLASRCKLLAAFSTAWGVRHLAAIRDHNPAFIHEHATFDHVLIAPEGRFVTYDLEVAFTGRSSVQALVAGEIAGYLRSLFKRIPTEERDAFLMSLASTYPDRGILSRVPVEFLRSPSPIRRMVHRCLEARAGNASKYTVAREMDHIFHP